MIQIKHLSKRFDGKENSVEALRDISLTIPDGSIYGIIGMSGAGKSTLVRCINMLEKPTAGQVFIGNTEMTALNEKQLRQERRKIAMIFQHFNLLMQRNSVENICLPMELAGYGKEEAKKRAYEMLEVVGLRDKALAYPSQLSGGQKQRIAIARALSLTPEILLCDEATSALDPTTTSSILQLLRQINQTYGITIVMITHQMSVVEEICDRVAILDQGVVREEGTVQEIFTAPKSDAAKALVFPEGILDYRKSSEDGNLLRLVFNGVTATQPIIAQMAMTAGVPASIVSAQTKSIHDRTYGNMILSIPGEAEEKQRALCFLQGIENISVTELKEEQTSRSSEERAGEACHCYNQKQ